MKRVEKRNKNFEILNFYVRNQSDLKQKRIERTDRRKR